MIMWQVNMNGRYRRNLGMFLVTLIAIAALNVPLVAHSLPCGTPGAGAQIMQNENAGRCLSDERQYQAYPVARIALPSHRLASSRPTRLLPTYGGKPNRNTVCRSANDISYKPINYCSVLLQSLTAMRSVMKAPRYYYVIALGRLLC